MGTWREKRVLRLEFERHGQTPSREQLAQLHRAWWRAKEANGMSIADYVAGLRMPAAARRVAVRANNYVTLGWEFPDPAPQFAGGLVMAFPQKDMDAARIAAREQVRAHGGTPWF